MTSRSNRPALHPSGNGDIPVAIGSAKEAVLCFIPTKNDRDLLADLVAGVQRLDASVTVLVIDDGSCPGIEKSSLPDGCLLFSVPSNVGLGMCTHIAIDHALTHGYDYIVRLDADGQHPIAMIPELLKPLRDRSADMVAGLRSNHRGKSEPDAMMRRLVKWYFSFLSRIITSGGAPDDVSSGFFAANRQAMRTINEIVLERYPEPQLYSHVCRSGLRVAEVNLEQAERQHGKSSITYAHAFGMIYRFTVYAFSELLRLRP
jgi:glycosyltransferase involved in cell wall biosynthesis